MTARLDDDEPRPWSAASWSTWPTRASNDARASRRSGCAARHPAGSCWTARPAGSSPSAGRRRPDPQGAASLAWFGDRRWRPTYLGVGEGARTDVARWALDRRPGRRLDGRRRPADRPSAAAAAWTPTYERPGSCSLRRPGAGTRTRDPTDLALAKLVATRAAVDGDRRGAAHRRRPGLPRRPAGAGLPRRPGRAHQPAARGRRPDRLRRPAARRGPRRWGMTRPSPRSPRATTRPMSRPSPTTPGVTVTTTGGPDPPVADRRRLPQRRVRRRPNARDGRRVDPGDDRWLPARRPALPLDALAGRYDHRTSSNTWWRAAWSGSTPIPSCRSTWPSSAIPRAAAGRARRPRSDRPSGAARHRRVRRARRRRDRPEPPTPFAATFLRLAAEDPPRWRLFGGWLDDEIVTTAALFTGSGIAGIYAVSTADAMRGRGYGRAATMAALHAGRDEGRRPAS